MTSFRPEQNTQHKMATSLLRIGRLGTLKNICRGSLGVHGARPAALYCTHEGEPVKAAKKTKAAAKTVMLSRATKVAFRPLFNGARKAAEDPDGRAALLAYKTTVAFPLRLSEFLSGAEPASPSTLPAETDAAAAATATAQVTAATEAAVTEPEPVVASLDQAPGPDVAPVVADATPPVADAVAPEVETSSQVLAAEDTAAAAAQVTAATEAAITEPEPVEPVVASLDQAPIPDVAPVVADTAPPVADAAPPEVETSSQVLAAEDTPAVPHEGLPPPAASSEPGQTEAYDSSASSSSSSDSDSDSDDEKSEVETGAKISPPVDPSVNVAAAEVPESKGEGQEGPEAASTSPAEVIHEVTTPLEAAQVDTQASIGSSEELVDSAPNVCTGAEDVPEVASEEASVEPLVDCPPPAPAEAAAAPAEAAEVSTEAAEVPAETAEVPAEAADVSAEGAEVSAESAATPDEAVEVSAEAAEAAEVAAEVSVESVEAPTEAAEVLAEAAAVSEVSAEVAEVSAEAAAAPAEVAEVSAEAAAAPAEVAEVSTEAAAAPAEVAEVSAEAAAAPAEVAEVSAEAATAPAEVAEVSTEAADVPVEVAAAPEALSVEASPELVDSETIAAEAAVPDSAQELVDPAPVIAEAAGEELQAEAPAEQPEEAAALSPPEPEEPFDNTTYKNYQHHGYNPYTFADLDLEMAKFRLPQPSSGRPSPRH